MKEPETIFFSSENCQFEIIYSRNSHTKYPNHTHAESYTIGFIMDGDLLIQGGGVTQKNIVPISNGKNEVGAGNFFVIPPDVVHQLEPLQNTYSMLVVCIRQDYLLKTDMDALYNEVKSMMEKLIRTQRITIPELNQLFDAITMLYSFVSGIMMQDHLSVREAKEILHSAPENPLSVELLAQKVYVSPYYLIRSFQKNIGLTPHQFQIQSRIRKAQKLLRENDNITEIALVTGFCDQSHFDKCFKSIVCMTPTEYIRSQREL